MILARTRNKSLEYLNTSYVKVQLVFWTILPMLSVYLNTSYVKVQFFLAYSFLYSFAYLNTSYVKVQLTTITDDQTTNAFKYILC